MPPPRFSRENMGIIEAKGIFHSYNGKDTVLNGIDLSVEKGEFLSVLGASGSGKPPCFPCSAA